MKDIFNRNICFINKNKSLAIIEDKFNYIIVSGITINQDNILIFKNVEHFTNNFDKALFIVNNFKSYMENIEKRLNYDR